MARIRILLIEDNRLLREGITAMLSGHGEFEVVARSEDGDAVRQCKSMGHPPDVVLLDLGLEKVNSLFCLNNLTSNTGYGTFNSSLINPHRPARPIKIR